ncbi:hypothetical protein [uncultured Desulfosarcina sp.]|uniref:hypothetical protein n=1 Tax=uncultured Desulfosarcina sp. TaxID=218289 RepID=UPI0037484060
MSKVYRAQGSSSSDAPDYVIRDGRFYRTVHHPAGWSDTADYEIRGDGKVYALKTGAGGQSPVYEFREIMLYRTRAHPNGAGEQPEYYIYD